MLVGALHLDTLEDRAHPGRGIGPVNGTAGPLRRPRRRARIPNTKLQTSRVGGVVQEPVLSCVIYASL